MGMSHSTIKCVIGGILYPNVCNLWYLIPFRVQLVVLCISAGEKLGAGSVSFRKAMSHYATECVTDGISILCRGKRRGWECSKFSNGDVSVYPKV